MEDLTRTQTVLLCVLVSFVTSIGTGIITVSLLQEAPPGVTQTINQVVERTVERVVPGPSSGGQTVRETTVVVKEEDLVIDSIKKNEKSLVRIATVSGSGSAQSPNVIALGLVVSIDGNILVDRRVVPASGGSSSSGNSLVAIFHDGRQFPLKTISGSTSSFSGSDFIYLEVAQDSKAPAYVFYPAITTNSDTIQLGQTIIALGGKTQSQVATGRVSSLNFSSVGSATSTSAGKPVSLIQIENSLRDETSGALLLNLTGELVGVESWHPEAPSLPDQFIPINMIKIAGAKFFK